MNQNLEKQLYSRSCEFCERRLEGEWCRRSDGTHMQPDRYPIIFTTDLDRYIQGRPQNVMRVGVYPPSTVRVSSPFTYPIQSLGLYVAKELLSPISRHPGGDIFRLLWYDRSHFNGIIRWFLGASCQSVVRGHLLQQGSHGGTS